MALLRPHVKWAAAARRVAELPGLLEQAFRESQSGVPGPVFLECPIDLLYDEATVRRLYGAGSGGRGLVAQATRLYLRQHVRRLFVGMSKAVIGGEIRPAALEPDPAMITRVAQRLLAADRPVLLVGSQALLAARDAAEIARAVERLGIPTYLWAWRAGC